MVDQLAQQIRVRHVPISPTKNQNKSLAHKSQSSPVTEFHLGISRSFLCTGSSPDMSSKFAATTSAPLEKKRPAPYNTVNTVSL